MKNADAICWSCGTEFDFDAEAAKASGGAEVGAHRIRTHCPNTRCRAVNFNVYARARWDADNQPLPLARREAR